MGEVEPKTKKSKAAQLVAECGCNPKQLNHFTVEISDCKRHPLTAAFLNRDKHRDNEYDAEYAKMQGKILYDRQERMKAAEAIVAGVHAQAAKEGRKATFADLRRAAGIPDTLLGKSFGKIPDRLNQAARRDAKNERNAERAMVDPPPDFDPNIFDAWREGARLAALAADLPDDQEHAAEYAILTEIGRWLAENRECGRDEYDQACNGIRAEQSERKDV